MSIDSMFVSTCGFTAKHYWEKRQKLIKRRPKINKKETSCLDGLDLTKQVNLLLFNINKAAESKQVKQEVSCTVRHAL